MSRKMISEQFEFANTKNIVLTMPKPGNLST